MDKKIVIVLVALFLGGCMSDVKEEYRAMQKDRDLRAVEQCFNQGGIPITSAFDGKLKTCEFKEPAND